jgi:hypothetical protein
VAAVLGSLATRGVLGFLCIALGLGAASAAAAGWALRAVQAGAEPILASFLCFPPCALVAAAGVVLAGAGAARGPASLGTAPEAPEAPEERQERARRRVLILAGMAAAIAALLAEPWVGPLWGRAVRRWLPL